MSSLLNAVFGTRKRCLPGHTQYLLCLDESSSYSLIAADRLIGLGVIPEQIPLFSKSIAFDIILVAVKVRGTFLPNA